MWEAQVGASELQPIGAETAGGETAFRTSAQAASGRGIRARDQAG